MKSKYESNSDPYFYPSKDELLLVKAGIGDNQRDVVSHFQHWIDFHGFEDFRFDERFVLPLVYDRLEEGSKRLLPLVYSNFKRLRIDDEIVNQFAGYHRYTTFKNRMLKNELDGILHQLSKGGHHYYVRKGLVYLELFYGDYGARPTSDIDIVINHKDVTKLLSSRTFDEWVSDTNWKLNRIEHSLEHAITLKKGRFELDLHWRFGHHPIPKVWHKEIISSVRKRNGIETLSNEFHLIDTLTHGYRYNDTVRPIRWISDAVQILRNGIDDWAIVLEYSKDCKAKIPIYYGLNFISQEKLGSIPDDVIRTLRNLKISKAKAVYFYLTSKTSNNFVNILKYAISTSRNPFQVPFKVLNHYKLNWNQSNYLTLIFFLILVTFEKLITKRKVFLKRLRKA